MKRYTVFVIRFALAPMISGTFVVSTNGRASLVEWAHIITGFITVYLIVGLVLLSFGYRELRLPAAAALIVVLGETIPGTPRLHAALSPVLFAILGWAAVARPVELRGLIKSSRSVFVLPALVLPVIFYGVGYRHQTSGIWPHIGLAMFVAAVILISCLVVLEKNADDAALRGVTKLTIAAAAFQIVAGFATLILRILELNGGLALAIARTVHITGAAQLLGASVILAIQYRRRLRPSFEAG